MPDLRVIEVERLITGTAAVSLFRDRKADEPDGWVSHDRQHCLGIFGGDQHVVDDLDLLRRFHARRCHRDGGVDEVLCRQNVTNGR